MSIRFRALNAFTDKLPLIDIGAAPSVYYARIAQQTADALRAGVVSGMVYEMEGYIRQMLTGYPKTVIFFTGGDAPAFHTCIAKRFSSIPIILDPHLALKGLNRILTQLPPSANGATATSLLKLKMSLPRF
jgi:type III pantothenate kinase